MSSFTGFTEDTYRFFWELAFNNSRAFMEQNRARYRTVVYEPLRALTEVVSPTVLEIDDRLSTRYSQVISRINRDTRYSLDKSPYRDHAWIGFRFPGVRTGAGFVLYAEFERESYGYGMGMYAPNSELMQELRDRMLARPKLFLDLVSAHKFAERFSVQGEAYKRPHFPDAPEALQPYVNLRNLSFCYSNREISNTMCPEIADEVIDGFLLLKPVYRFLMGLA